MSGRSVSENLEVLPNPVLYHAEVRLREQGEHFISYKIIDSNGIILKARKIRNNNGPVASVDIHMDNTLPGLYFLIVKTNRSSYAKKVIKLDYPLQAP